MSKFIESAESRETSIEIMQVIETVADDEADAVRIWESPTDAERELVCSAAERAADLDETLFWGGSLVS